MPLPQPSPWGDWESPGDRPRVLLVEFPSGRGWIRLIVGFQPLMVISPPASWIRWCMQVYACELMWTCLVWPKRSTPDSFWVPSHRFNSATGELKWITQTIYTDSEAPSRLPNSLIPSAKLRRANLPLFLTSLVWRGRGSNPAPSRTPSGRSNHCATQGRWVPVGIWSQPGGWERLETLTTRKRVSTYSAKETPCFRERMVEVK